jgi:hypothetical protein
MISACGDSEPEEVVIEDVSPIVINVVDSTSNESANNSQLIVSDYYCNGQN